MDHISRVWDLWYADLRERKNNNRDKRKGNSPIAVSCVVISPNKNSFGLGASAHPDYRHSKIATHLI